METRQKILATIVAVGLLLVFILALCLQFSVKISALENRVKNLAQQLALDDAERDRTADNDEKKDRQA